MSEKKRGNFSGTIGFVLAAAGSAVGLGNIWRFPYLAAKDHGGVFILCYIILALTFGFALLTTEIAIGRKTKQSPLTAYGKIHKKWKGIGVLACLVPIIILPYYCAIGGWVIKYFTIFVTGKGSMAAGDKYFTEYIKGQTEPIFWMGVFLALTAIVVFSGVNKGIEKYSKILMPLLLVLIIGISVYSLTISHTDSNGVTRTGLEGLKIYLIPDFTGISLKEFFVILMDAMGQLFFSISVAMGIMIAYGSYVKKDVNLMKSINQIEIFDTVVALLAGLMIVPAVFTFMGREGMSAGPGLMFVSLPKVFAAMGKAGPVVGILFFLMVIFAAVTSAVSVMEAIVSSIMDGFHLSRRKSAALVTIYGLVGAVVVCLGYNVLRFEWRLPNGTVGQVLDVLDYISNNCLMPLVALLTCILVGWVVKPETVIDEVCHGGYRFSRKGLYIAMMKVLAPILLFVLLIQSIGLLRL
ncbi:MAG: sodium-dependent transporter [Lachnospiraceae bacterium]|nr:sodium-dependent transporter [Lachnospiraceae bacterium]